MGRDCAAVNITVAMIGADGLILVKTGADLLDHQILEARGGVKHAFDATLNLWPGGLIEVSLGTFCKADGIFVALQEFEDGVLNDLVGAGFGCFARRWPVPCITSKTRQEIPSTNITFLELFTPVQLIYITNLRIIYFDVITLLLPIKSYHLFSFSHIYYVPINTKHHQFSMRGRMLIRQLNIKNQFSNRCVNTTKM